MIERTWTLLQHSECIDEWMTQELSSIKLRRGYAGAGLSGNIEEYATIRQGPNAVSFTGGVDPLLATPFRIAAAGAAALAATGLAAAELWQQRTGRPQTVTVDLRHATASLRGGLYMRLGGGPLPDERNPIMGVYPTRDGRWAYIHSNSRIILRPR